MTELLVPPNGATPAPVDPSNTASPVKRRIFVVEDHPIFRHGLLQVIDNEPDLEVCGEASSAPAALGALREANADLVVTDVCLQGTNGVELTKQLRAEHPNIPILVLSMHDESLYAVRALKAGANGFVMKRAGVDVFLEAIRRVLKGKLYVSSDLGEQLIHQAIRGTDPVASTPVDLLTDRELEILEMIGKGRSSREIATELNLSAKTIESHRLRMKNKMGMKSAAELVRFAVDWTAERY
jgi:DNA-binding NarL/FixJ family response regulator